MSKISRGVFAALAVSLTLGAVQFASGHDLTGSLGINPLGIGSAAPQGGVNRSAKTDRAGALATSSALTRTISIRLDSLADTSVLIRIPLARATRSVPPALVPAKPADRKQTVACEPVVSTLTEVAKLLQPGRCVT
ncbi:MAG TPA: hypothetical protein VGH29_14895 [Candidatus Binataceae bacterium]|jgi:hypothetical protein